MWLYNRGEFTGVCGCGGWGLHIPLARGGAREGGGVLFFMIKQKIIRDKMRYSNLNCEQQL